MVFKVRCLLAVVMCAAALAPGSGVRGVPTGDENPPVELSPIYNLPCIIINNGGWQPGDIPMLAIYPQGQVRAYDHLNHQLTKSKLTPAEVQELFRLIVDNKFFDIDKKAVAEAFGKEQLHSMYMEIKTKQQDRREVVPSVHWRYLFHHHAFPDHADAKRLMVIQRRLFFLMMATRAGGADKVKAALDLGNAELRQKYPQASPFTLDELQCAVPGGSSTFVRGEPRYSMTIHVFADRPANFLINGPKE